MAAVQFRAGGNYDLLYRDPENPNATPLPVHTSRPCGACGQPLIGIVVDQFGRPGTRVHLRCRRSGNRG